MSNRIPESELILREDGSVYHLKLLPQDLAGTVILVGDPGRVATVSKYFDQIEVKKQNREITTHTGIYNGKRLTVMSTGMGTDNIDICVNELDALVNIDLNTRLVKQQQTALNIVRIGTSGGLQSEVPLGTYVVSSHGIGLDILLQYYQRNPSADVQSMTAAFVEHIASECEHLRPYIAEGSRSLIERFADKCVEGITVSAAGFYAPQGRILRFGLAMPNLVDKLHDFEHKGRRITNFEMETSGIYGLGHEILGHNCCSVNLIIADRRSKTSLSNYAPHMEEMIQMVLNKLTQ